MTLYLATFLALSILGIADVGYLLSKRIGKKPLVCPINGDCNAVVESRYATTFGIHNDILGLFYYLFLCASALTLLLKPDLLPDLPRLIMGITGFGVIFSAYLTYLQAYIIKEYCFYCLGSAGISLLLFLNSLVL